MHVRSNDGINVENVWKKIAFVMSWNIMTNKLLMIISVITN